MNIEKFELEWWLNPYDAIATHNMGSSCCKPMNMQELFELDGVSRDEVMDEIANMSLHYGYFEGMPRLKDAVAGLFETPQVSAQNVMVVHGATSANALTCYALCEKGDNVIVVVPSYQQFVSIPAALGCEVRQYVSGPEDGFGINFRRLADMVDGHTKAIFLTSPSNPTGYGMSREELEQLAAIARPVGAYVVCDEIYRGLTEGYAASIVDVYERGISTGGTSKVFSSAGLRIGWIVTRDLGLTHVIKNLRSFNTICESPITELLAAIVLEHKEEIFARNRKICAEGRAALNEWLKGQPHLHLACESQGSTSFLTYDWDIPTKEFCEGLFDKTGALVCHGMCFNMEHGFRIGYGYGDVEYFKAGLAKLAEYTQGLSDDLLIG
ncbi:aminotransferase class I/II-fold pyridoxal phosphate-dependent enzyme [Olsenella intestinalis]|uniref:aminotransferase class I/II-fold pyridoxal phosphate-dependent enzyme n=1 Tax=Olsenella intestinalis TaxID=2930083 RepID=UPI00200FB2BD|nr:aminotransferase class I/II-fold pyridoxal phosphate-dependent enzyme [Olsenella intestinalis]